MSKAHESARLQLQEYLEGLSLLEMEILIDKARGMQASRGQRPTGPPRIIWNRNSEEFATALTSGQFHFLTRENLAERRRGGVAWRCVHWGYHEPILDRRLLTGEDIEVALSTIAAEIPWLTIDTDRRVRLTVSSTPQGRGEHDIILASAFRRVHIRSGSLYLDDAGKKHLASLVASHTDAAVL